MADFDTIRAGRVGTGALAIDEGLRAHMNMVYGLMSVGMVLTAAAAWALGGLTVTDTPTAYQIGATRYLTDVGYALYASPLKWVIMFLPLIMVYTAWVYRVLRGKVTPDDVENPDNHAY